MKNFKNQLFINLFKSDFLQPTKNQLIDFLTQFYNLSTSLKQLIQILQSNKRLPIIFVCRNRQHIFFINKCFSKILNNKIFFLNVYLLSYKNAVTYNNPAIYILLSSFDTRKLSLKIKQHSNSIIYLIANKLDFTYGDEYFLNLHIQSLKQIIFIILLIKKIKINANF